MYELKSQTTWAYKNNEDNTERYLLGVCGDNPLKDPLKDPLKGPLICIGLNPSDAEPNYLDSTVMKVERISKDFGYNGWMMLNLCSIRNKIPKEMKKRIKSSNQKENIAVICNIINENLKERGFCTVLAAWGHEIGNSKQLKNILKLIIMEVKQNKLYEKIMWKKIEDKKNTVHPQHPGRISNKISLTAFKIDDYLNEL